MKYIFFLQLMLLTACASVKEVNLIPRYKTISYYMNGPVKSNWALDSLKLKDAVDQNQFLREEHNGEVLALPDYISFHDKSGLPLGGHNADDNYQLKTDNEPRSSLFVYFQNDLEKKKFYKQVPWPKNVYNPYEIKLHKFPCYISDKTGKMNLEDRDCQASNFFSEYKIDQNGKILNEYRYWGRYTSDHKSFVTKNLLYTVDWQYNKKNQIIKKKYQLEPDDIGFSIDHDLEVSPKRHTPVEVYTYDDQGRLTSFKTYKFKEDYEEDGYVSVWEKYNYEGDRLAKKRTYIVKGAAAFLDGVKDERILYYNEQEDVVKIEALNEDGSIYQTYYYDYDYDHYNNWIKCRKYINQKTKIPHNVLTRVITYYEEEKKPLK